MHGLERRAVDSPTLRAVRTGALILAVLCAITAPQDPNPYVMRLVQTVAIAGIAAVSLLRWRRSRRTAWRTIGLAGCGWLAAMVLGWMSVAVDSPDLLRVARTAFGASSLVGIVGLVQLLRVGTRRQHVIQLLDAVVVAAAAAVVLAVVLSPSIELDTVVERLGTPWVGALASLCMAAIAATAAIGQPTRALARWLALGLGLSLVGDLLQLAEMSDGVVGSATGFNGLLAAGALVMLVATLTPDTDEAHAPQVPRWRRAVLAGMVLVAVLFALADLLIHGEVLPVTALAGGVMVASQSAALLLALSELRHEADSRGQVLGQLRISEARLNATLDTTPVGIGVAAERGTIVLANTALATMVGLDVRDLLGRRWQEFMEPATGATAEMEAGTAGPMGSPVTVARAEDDPELFWMHRIDGTDRMIEVTRRRYPTAGREVMWLASIVDVTERLETLAELAHRANHDELTGLPNRHAFSETLDEHIAHGAGGVLLVLDLDQFKYVNDTLGHSSGDDLLVATAGRLTGLAPSGCRVARIGGDEFCVLTPPGFPEPLDTVGAMFAEPFDVDGEALHTTASIGGTTTRTTATAEELLAEADAAMYRAKALGPGRREMYLPSTGASMARLHRTIGELHRALEDDELELWYQPVMSTSTGRVEGLEALLRWEHPARGLLTPDQFVPVAEHSGLIGALGDWAMRTALDAGVTPHWSASGPALSLNVSASQVADPRFVHNVAECLDATGFDPDRLWLEITESALLADERTAGRTCAGLVDLGIHLAIDDFGTGFGSLTYLLQFPVEAIKIDRSFVAGIGVAEGAPPPSTRGALRGAAIVSSLVGLAEKLGLVCVAEGVERQEQLDALVELGCPLAQGHHLGRPAREPRLPEPVDQASPDAVAAGTRGGPLHVTGEGV